MHHLIPAWAKFWTIDLLRPFVLSLMLYSLLHAISTISTMSTMSMYKEDIIEGGLVLQGVERIGNISIVL